MVFGKLTIGLDPIALPLSSSALLGVRILARAANSGSVYIGIDPTITANGDGTNLIPKGAPGTVNPYTLPPGWYRGENTIYFIADNTDQIIDWSAE